MRLSVALFTFVTWQMLVVAFDNSTICRNTDLILNDQCFLGEGPLEILLGEDSTVTDGPSLEPKAFIGPNSLPEFLSFSEWRDRQVPANGQPQKSGKAKKAKVRPDGAFVDDHRPSSALPNATADQLPGEHISESALLANETLGPPQHDSSKDSVASDSPPPQYDDIALENQPQVSVQPLPQAGVGGPDDPLTTLKTRTNFASLDCAAAVLQSSKSTRGASAILSSAKDRYMLTPCSVADKFVVVELCEEIDIDAIVLANWEFFSSMFKAVRATVSQVYPGRSSDWRELGLFRAGNVRGAQVRVSSRSWLLTRNSS